MYQQRKDLKPDLDEPILTRYSCMALMDPKIWKSEDRCHCSVLFFSRPWSEGWPHHGRTFSIYLCPLSFWLTLPRTVLSTQAVSGLPRLRAPGIVPCIIFLQATPVSSWCDFSMLASLLWQCPSLLQLIKKPLICFLCCPWNLQNLSQSFHLKSAVRKLAITGHTRIDNTEKKDEFTGDRYLALPKSQQGIIYHNTITLQKATYLSIKLYSDLKSNVRHS